MDGEQCDQMANYLYNIWLFRTMKFFKLLVFCESSFYILPITVIVNPQKLPDTFKKLPNVVNLSRGI